MKQKKKAPAIKAVNKKQLRTHSRLMKLLSNRKLRCGALSVFLTILMIAAVVLINSLASSVENKWALTVDFSFNSLTTQSETTKAVLQSLQDDVHIYFVHSQSGDISDSTVLTADSISSILNRYAVYEHVTWSEENIVKNPTLASRFEDMLGENAVSSNCLIVWCEQKNRARVLTEDDFLSISYNTNGYYEASGYSYEKCLTEAILYVSQEELPTLQFLSGHGELTASDTEEMESMLVSNNYQVKRITLADELDVSSPLLILSPQLDFSDSELEKLLDFAKEGGDFFIISSYSDPVDLTNFNQLLSLYGVTPLDGLCVAKESAEGSYYESTAILIPYMQTTEATESLVSAGKDILLLTGARAFERTAEMSSYLTVDVLLKSGEAYLRDYNDGSESLDQQPQDPEGEFTLAVLSTRVQTNGNRSSAFIIGNSSVFLDSWIYTNTHASEFLLQMLKTLQGQEPINLDIVQKPIARNTMTYQSLALPTILSLLLPMLVLAAALIVLLPRKNK